jgi:hypothetical protein
LLLLAAVFPASSSAQAQSDAWPRLGASSLVYRGRIRQATELNGGWANFELVAGAERSNFWYSGFPAYWNGAGWEVEPGRLGLRRRIEPAF